MGYTSPQGDPKHLRSYLKPTDRPPRQFLAVWCRDIARSLGSQRLAAVFPDGPVVDGGHLGGLGHGPGGTREINSQGLFQLPKSLYTHKRHVCICVHACIHVRRRAHVSTYAYMCTYVHMYVHMLSYARSYTYVLLTCAYVCVYTCITFCFWPTPDNSSAFNLQVGCKHNFLATPEPKPAFRRFWGNLCNNSWRKTDPIPVYLRPWTLCKHAVNHSVP